MSSTKIRFSSTMRRAFALLTVVIVASSSVSAEEDVLDAVLWESVSNSNNLTVVENFISTFPNSQNIAAARALADELRGLENDDSADDSADGSMEESIFDTIGAVTYNDPLSFGDENLIGRTLVDIAQSSPKYPPIEGLPDEVWKDKTCNSCHQWNRERLCTQANIYISQNPERYRNKPHPFGGLLKINLRNWAQNDCS